MEAATRIEPCLFDDTTPTVLSDLAVEIQREANELGRLLPAKTLTELADLVRLMRKASAVCVSLFVIVAEEYIATFVANSRNPRCDLRIKGELE